MSERPTVTGNDRRVIPWLLFGLLVLFGGIYVAGGLDQRTGSRAVRPVSGVAIGGLRTGCRPRRAAPPRASTAGRPSR